MSGALIAMSGGVDSSVAALLAVERGLDSIGGMMKLFDSEDLVGGRADSCRALDDAEDARAVANKLGIQFYVFNFANVFREMVIEKFVEAYQNGETPNPCVDCNRYLKFGQLLRRAKELGKEYVVTGHYARIERGAGGGRLLLKKGADLSKDQSYVLYSMTQEQLGATLFPLGGLCKEQVREMAMERGFGNAKKGESQDICFVREGSYADFILRHTGKEFPGGRFVDKDGRDLGGHKGIVHYTVGQRRGLGLAAGSPLYVCGINAGNNSVVVGHESDLYSKTLIAKDANLIPVDRLDTALKARVRIRYNQQEQPATVWQLDAGTLRIEFDSPQKAVTKGQAAVIYDGDVVVGGGTIS